MISILVYIIHFYHIVFDADIICRPEQFIHLHIWDHLMEQVGKTVLRAMYGNVEFKIQCKIKCT